MNPLRRLFVLVFEPRPRAQPTRHCPTLAQTEEPVTVITFTLDDLRRARPGGWIGSRRRSVGEKPS